MRNADEAIDRVLAGLRDVEAPEGLERRVLAGLEERAAVRSGWRPALGWVVGFGVAAVVVAGILMVRSPRVPEQRFAGVGVKAPIVVPVRAEQEQKRNTGVLQLAPNDVNFRGVQRVQTIRPVEVAAVEPVEQERGFPAPPMPLTEEEKLLLRVAHRVDPQELTPLNAEARARQEAEFDEEFMEFFAVPVAVEDETNPTEDDKGEVR